MSIFYNKKLTSAAGVADADLANLTWNPTDGGTYEKAIAHLTIDNNGKRGDEAGFDKTKVKVYGLGLDGGSGGGNGQTQWSMYTGTTGWTVTDKEPLGHALQLRQARVSEHHDLDAVADREGLHAQRRGRHRSELCRHLRRWCKYAMITNGSWMINQMNSYKGVETMTAPTPVGPSGKRSSMYNGLADSVWTARRTSYRDQVGRVPRLGRLPRHRR